ncbi:hypothetical protein [Paenibacillus qinlingensis]|uniref:Uncharacterized protein n=1 Tax=Paenibacillus qinlingensis TaxID=1837343 RepID=A0ABU1NTS7_9BACL|nr:hypothetical protein [Paenibacillus qinlingensis]MDR6550890.1 hypothetical protein [Paenibacillus qinlingensis]
MILKRDRISVEEAQGLIEKERVKFDKYILWGDPVEGEMFVHLPTGGVHIVKVADCNEQLVFCIYSTEDCEFIYEECFPLLSTGNLIELLSFDLTFEFRTRGDNKWRAFLDHEHFESEKGQDLVAFLWSLLRKRLNGEVVGGSCY